MTSKISISRFDEIFTTFGAVVDIGNLQGKNIGKEREVFKMEFEEI